MWKEQKYNETKELIPKDQIILSGIVYNPNHFDKERKVDKTERMFAKNFVITESSLPLLTI